MTAEYNASRAGSLRAEAAEALLSCAPDAFLRWSRGDGLLVTDAPRRGTDLPALRAALAARGWTCERLDSGLLELSPTAERLRALEAASAADPSGALAAGLARFRGEEIQAEDLRLAFAAVKLTALGGDAAACEKRVRQRAALALRAGRGGGLLYLCAALLETGQSKKISEE